MISGSKRFLASVEPDRTSRTVAWTALVVHTNGSTRTGFAPIVGNFPIASCHRAPGYKPRCDLATPKLR